ncbi:IS66 family insertion sequence element accessory protein TnpB [Paenibacillus sp. B1-33]|uniref:IS66 family insertion sequence element accessory protein TnpB n=1 Tax=unclassified Paenibacillus TaxID=185978 RepID=UPI003D2C83FE
MNTNKLKILYWEHNGIGLFYRRVERGTFQGSSSGKRVSNPLSQTIIPVLQNHSFIK